MTKVRVTNEVLEKLLELKKTHNNLILVHSEGCCDGTSLLCTTRDDIYIGSKYDEISNIEGISYYMHESNKDYWKYLNIKIDITEGRGTGFSLENLEDKTFIIIAETK